MSKIRPTRNNIAVRYLDIESYEETAKFNIVVVKQNKKEFVTGVVEAVGPCADPDIKEGETVLLHKYVGQRAGVDGTDDYGIVVVSDEHVIAVVEEG